MALENLKDLEQYTDDLLERRRFLHQHPETSFNEFKTVEYIEGFLQSLNHVEIIKPTQTSVIGVFKSKQAGSRIGLRADIDALPIQEELTNLDFCSMNDGVMHACGHDGHTAMLMTACQWLDDHFDTLEGEIYCIFQHAEELPPGGASQIMATGVLDDLDFIYGQHVLPEIEVGTVDIKTGPVTTNSDGYKVTLYGLGGHASTPSKAINPINLASKLIQAFNEIPSQHIDAQQSAVVSNTYIKAGNSISLNIIPDTLEFGGNIRSFDADVPKRIEESMKQILEGICGAYGVGYKFNYEVGARSVYNDDVKTTLLQEIVGNSLDVNVIERKPDMFGEDFSVYSQVIPATFAMIGSHNHTKETQYPLHHPKFNIDEGVLIVGLKMLLTVAIEYNKKITNMKLEGELV